MTSTCHCRKLASAYSNDRHCTLLRHILKTNFYKPGKTALAFRLDPAFLDNTLYPETPFGVFMIVGAEFRGFHVRFRDVARGGVRLVQSRYPQAYSQNVINLFDECYNLVRSGLEAAPDVFYAAAFD